MPLTHSFTLPTGIDRAWASLQDLERVVACLPGAELDAVAGDEYRGSMTIERGSVAHRYRGKLRLAELDPSAYTAVLKATGTECDGPGTARATIVAALAPADEGTAVTITTDLVVTDGIAPTRHGASSDDDDRWMARFVEALSREPTDTADDEPEDVSTGTDVLTEPYEEETLESPFVVRAPDMARIGAILATLAVVAAVLRMMRTPR